MSSFGWNDVTLHCDEGHEEVMWSIVPTGEKNCWFCGAIGRLITGRLITEARL